MLGKFKEWWASPFQPSMDVPHWFLFIGLLIFVMVGWRLVLSTIREAST